MWDLMWVKMVENHWLSGTAVNFGKQKNYFFWTLTYIMFQFCPVYMIKMFLKLIWIMFPLCPTIQDLYNYMEVMAHGFCHIHKKKLCYKSFSRLQPCFPPGAQQIVHQCHPTVVPEYTRVIILGGIAIWNKFLKHKQQKQMQKHPLIKAELPDSWVSAHGVPAAIPPLQSLNMLLWVIWGAGVISAC